MVRFHDKYYLWFTTVLLLFSLGLPLSKSASTVFLSLAYVLALVAAVAYRDFREAVVQSWKQPLTAAFLLFICAATVGLFFQSGFFSKIHSVYKFMSIPLVYLMASVLLQAGRDKIKESMHAENMLVAFMVGLFLLNVIGVLVFTGIVGNRKFSVPLEPLHVHHIWYANINAIGFYIAVLWLLLAPRRGMFPGKAFLVSFIILASICIILSISRTAWFGMLFTGIVIAYTYIPSKKLFFASTAAILLGCVTIYVVHPLVHDRINLIVTDIRQYSAGVLTTSVGERFLMWKAAWKMFLTHPLMGVGSDEYLTALTEYVTSGEFPASLLQYNQPHNMYLFALATNGILGLSSLLYIFYRGLKFTLPLVKTQGKQRLFAFVGVATIIHFMVAGMTDSFFNIQILRFTFAFIMGVCVRNSMRSDGAPERQP